MISSPSRPFPHRLFPVLTFALFLFTVAGAQARKPVPAAEPCDMVNPFIGTAPLTDPKMIGYTPPYGWRVWAGLTFPGAALPHGMVQLSPVTTFVTGAGYQYDDDMINGFTHTNKGHWNLCNISVMPVVTTLYIEGSGDRLGPYHEKGYGSHYRHETEQASPGYYSVYLDDYKTKVELTATRRTGFHRYTFPASKDTHILIDLAKANQKITDAWVEVPDRTTIRGWQKFGRETIYFHAEFDRPFGESGVWKGGDHHFANDKRITESGPDIGAYARYTTTAGEVIQVRVGISFVSMDNAEANLRAENPGWDFAAVRARARETWRTLLNSVQVEGGTPAEREQFYTGIYHSFLWPVLRSDADGSFTGADGKTDRAGWDYYTTPSLWDTFRNKLTLVAMLEPEVMRDIIRSSIDRGKKTGWMPTFFHGDHAASMIAGAYLRGITDFDTEEAFRFMKKNATQSNPVRGNLDHYLSHGYVPELRVDPAALDEPPAPGNAATTKTLEYAYDDYSIALFAKALGKNADYDLFMKRADNYRTQFDPKTRFMRAKWENGEWTTPFDPKYPYYQYMYREANGWQSTFFVPHDVQGLIGLFGGNEPFITKLDSLFIVPWDPTHIARNVCCMIGQYSHGNQPAHQAPFMYNYAGQPWKTQRMVRTILSTMYGQGMDGLALPGMDDAGEMSSWYVFSAMGFYPVAPATKLFALSGPVFRKITIRMPEYVHGGKTFTIVAEGASPKNQYIQSMTIDGKPSTQTWISHDDMVAGKTVTFRMGSKPNTAWGTKAEDAPPVVR